MSEADVKRVMGTLLYQRLVALEGSDGEHELSEQVRKVVEYCAPTLTHVPDHLPEFTLHDAEHSARLVDLIPQFTPQATLEQLSALEIAILLMSAYLHDIGMACTQDERATLVKSDPDYLALSAGYGPLPDDPIAAKHEEDLRFGAFLRDHHAKRAATVIAELGRTTVPFAWRTAPFTRWVIAVCESHELPAAELRNTAWWPRDALVRDIRINVQYLAALLRLGDILDMDPERAPKVLLDFINPQNEKSREQWLKHRSIIGWDVAPEHVRLEAECSNPACERAVREYVDAIEAERRDCMLLVGSYRDEIGARYGLNLAEPVTKEGIHSDGTYIYSDLHFQVDYRRVMELLMGESLYGLPEMALREVLQNSVDAVRTRAALELRDGNAYEPRIAVILTSDRLIVEDNGIGMDQHVFESFFVQVGKSYYQSIEFKGLGVDVDTTGEFGIGILSVFMVSDSFDVESRRRPEDPLHPPMPIKCSVRNAFDYFVQMPTNRRKIGTRLELVLKSGHPFEHERLPELVRRVAPAIEFAIQVTSSTGLTTITPQFPEDPPELFVTRFRVDVPCEVEPILEKSKGYIAVGGVDRETAGGVAQNGFAIGAVRLGGRRYDVDRLFPEWTTAYVSLDLRGRGRLGLRPDRSDIVWDRRADSLAAVVERRVLDSFDAHLREREATLGDADYAGYVDELLEEGSLTAQSHIGFKLPVGVREMFLDRVPLPIVGPDGSLARMVGRELMGHDTFGVVGSADCSEAELVLRIRDEFVAVVGRPAPLLVQGTHGDFSRTDLLRHVFGDPSEFIVTSVPGVVVELVRRDRPAGNLVDGYMSLAARVHANSGLPLIVHGASPCFAEHPMFNSQHPLLKPFLDANSRPRDKNCKELLVVLCKQFSIVLYRVSDFFPPEKWMTSKWGTSRMSRDRAINPLMTGFLTAHPEQLQVFQSGAESVWELARAAAVIGKDDACPRLTAADFPWFWSCKTA